MTRNRLITIALASLAVIGVGASASATGSTEAAWTDNVSITATATAGTWGSTCTWWNAATGEKVDGCEITEFTFHSWNPVGSRHRQYTISTSTPALPGGVAFFVTFDVDLSTAIEIPGGAAPEPDPDSFGWSGADLKNPANFTPAEDWGCGEELPTLRGVGGPWQPNFSFLVTEQPDTNNPGLCS